MLTHCVYFMDGKRKGGGENTWDQRNIKTECKFRITVPAPPKHIFIERRIIAIMYTALNSNNVRPDVSRLSKMGQ